MNFVEGGKCCAGGNGFTERWPLGLTVISALVMTPMTTGSCCLPTTDS
jgi:hypothetical protein